MREFYTREQLMTMPLKMVRSLDIQNKSQEELVQQVVDRRLAALPPSQPINRKDIPDIRTPDEEAHWQEVIDARTAKLKPQLMSVQTASSEKKGYEPVDLLDPEAENFSPDRVEMAEKAFDQSPEVSNRPQTVAERIAELEKPVAGTPIKLGGGVPAALRGKGKASKRK